jgi:hypothetical protein
MSRIKWLLIGVGLTASVIGVIAGLRLTRQRSVNLEMEKAPPTSTLSVRERKLAEYKVGRIIPNSNDPHDLHVVISIDPRQFVPEEMKRLACQLNHDYPDKQTLVVSILDDEYIARTYLPAGAEMSMFNKARRGSYQLNRIKEEESIEFSTARGKPLNEVRIKLR